MKYTQYTLLMNGLKALPAITPIGGAVAAYFLSASGMYAESARFGTYIIQDSIVGGAMGFFGGVALSLAGRIALYHVTVEDDPAHKDKRRADGTYVQSKALKVYDKSDLEDHNKSVQKMASKYEEKAKVEKAERSQILEVGTEGLKRQKMEKMGIKKK
jgi:hypothetical protein